MCLWHTRFLALHLLYVTDSSDRRILSHHHQTPPTPSPLPVLLNLPALSLSSPQVELQFGAVYEKYRYSCYYWECIILLEAFTLTLLLVLLTTQNNASLQVLVAMAVIFIEAVLHVSHPWLSCVSCTLLFFLTCHKGGAYSSLTCTLFKHVGVCKPQSGEPILQQVCLATACHWT